tara:strand:+ start:218 stop:1321 length:1104 start_codon:yes stop_codon:yes gene_type:complete
MSEPIITNTNISNNNITFTLEGVNVSIANGIRRTIISDIPVVVFKTYPENMNDATIIKNTTRMNNEIIKQRLSCIPIHIDDMEFPIETYILEINEDNKDENVKIITTEDFKIKNIQNDKYLPRDQVKKIFPPNDITKQYIDFVRLRPRISEQIPGESLHMTCKFSISDAKDDGMFNTTHTCVFNNTPDNDKIDSEWSVKEAEIKKEKGDINMNIERDNFIMLQGQRIFVPDSFDFTIDSIGIYKPLSLIEKGCLIIIKKIEKFIEDIQNNTDLISTSESTMNNCFDIKLVNEDYTIGKILEYYLYSEFFTSGKLSYCGFKKFHPHDNFSIIRIAYNNTENTSNITNDLIIISNNAIQTYKKILEQLQ